MLGGVIALRRRLRRRQMEQTFDTELKEFRVLEKYIKDNLTCTIEFSKPVIPPHKGKIEGTLVLEATADIEHSGIFILMKGLPVPERKKKPQQLQRKKTLTDVKFMVMMGSAGRNDIMQIDARSTESFPLELEIPNELPTPQLNSRGRLIYKMQVCIFTSKKRHVVVGETLLRWKGYKYLELEEVKKELKIEQLVQSKRGMMGLGRRRSAMMEWKVAKGGYLPGENVQVELWGECKEKEGLGMECYVELVQKVWFQVPSGIRTVQMYVNMKVHVLASGEPEDVIEMRNEEEGDDENKTKLLWQGKLKVPRGLTPTSKFNFMNSVSYTIRASIGLAGEDKESWVTGEVPLLIGTSKEFDDDDLDGKGAEEDEDDDEEEEELDPGSPSPMNLASPCYGEKGMNRPRRGSTGALGTGRLQGMNFMPSWARPRRSNSSIQSLASSTLSILRFPPSYSQLSSRRPSVETLPPAYSELEFQEQVVPLVKIHQQIDENMETIDISNLRLEGPEGFEEEAYTKDTENNFL